jgi:hypothetical protein
MSTAKSVKVFDPALFNELNPGDKVVLVSSFDETRPKVERFSLFDEKWLPTTNVSGEVKVNGWLGCTDNINKTAHGWHEIEAMEQITKLSESPIAGKRRPEVVGVKFTLSPA